MKIKMDKPMDSHNHGIAYISPSLWDPCQRQESPKWNQKMFQSNLSIDDIIINSLNSERRILKVMMEGKEAEEWVTSSTWDWRGRGVTSKPNGNAVLFSSFSVVGTLRNDPLTISNRNQN